MTINLSDIIRALSHSPIVTVAQRFGVTEEWLRTIAATDAFLSAPTLPHPHTPTLSPPAGEPE